MTVGMGWSVGVDCVVELAVRIIAVRMIRLEVSRSPFLIVARLGYVAHIVLPVSCGDAERCDFDGNVFIGCCPISAMYVTTLLQRNLS